MIPLYQSKKLAIEEMPHPSDVPAWEAFMARLGAMSEMDYRDPKAREGLETATAIIHASVDQWREVGQPSYYLTKDICKALEDTSVDLNRLPFGLVPEPHRTYYAELETCVELPGSYCDGFLITKGEDPYDQETNVPGLIICLFIRVCEPAFPELTETRMVVPLSFVPDDMDQPLAETLVGWTTDVGWVKGMACKMAVNIALFLDSLDEAPEKVEARGNYLRRQSQRKRGKKAKKLERQADNATVVDRWVVGLDYEYNPGPAARPQGEGTTHRRHIVRGHWRLQPYGRGRKLRKTIWIAPHVRGDASKGLVRKVYTDDPERAAERLRERNPG